MDAVIDKDLASALLAEEIDANIFLIATDVAGVMTNFGKPGEKMFHQLTLEDAKQHLQTGQFGVGSMKPKVEAVIQFVKHTGKRAVITSIAEIEHSVAGTAGTQFV